MNAGILKSTTATVQLGVAKADGKLTLTDSSLIFEPYNQQLGLGPYLIKRHEITLVVKCLNKAAGILPIGGDAIRITLTDGQTYEFLMAAPAQWIEILNNKTSKAINS